MPKTKLLLIPHQTLVVKCCLNLRRRHNIETLKHILGGVWLLVTLVIALGLAHGAITIKVNDSEFIGIVSLFTVCTLGALVVSKLPPSSMRRKDRDNLISIPKMRKNLKKEEEKNDINNRS